MSVSFSKQEVPISKDILGSAVNSSDIRGIGFSNNRFDQGHDADTADCGLKHVASWVVSMSEYAIRQRGVEEKVAAGELHAHLPAKVGKACQSIDR